MINNRINCDLAFIREASLILGIKTPKIEYVKDFRSIGQCADLGFKIKLCKNWNFTSKSGKYCRYLVLAHEMIHSRQHQIGDQVENWNGTTFKGQFISNKEYSDMANEEVPWEIEANELMWELRDKVIRSLNRKGILIKAGHHRPKIKTTSSKDCSSGQNSYDRIMKKILRF